MSHRRPRGDDDGERAPDPGAGADSRALQREIAEERHVLGEGEEWRREGEVRQQRGGRLAVGEAGEEFGGEASCEHARSMRASLARSRYRVIARGAIRAHVVDPRFATGRRRRARLRIAPGVRQASAGRRRERPGSRSRDFRSALRRLSLTRASRCRFAPVVPPHSPPSQCRRRAPLSPRSFRGSSLGSSSTTSSLRLPHGRRGHSCRRPRAPTSSRRWRRSLGWGAEAMQASGSEKLTSVAAAAAALPPGLVTLLVAVSCIAAFLLALPIAWTYMFTRQKKGYSQSVVHTLVLLPVVVAAVAVLVRNSIALAFSLAGILAAVRFRTSLEDSKDAVYIFVVSALGLACGVQLEVALVLSLLYIAIALALWQTDFARTPPALEGKRAEQHMQRAVAIANRTSQFVARLDREILETLAPEQLDALASRVRRRRGEVPVAGADGTEDRPRFDGRVTDRDRGHRRCAPGRGRNTRRARQALRTGQQHYRQRRDDARLRGARAEGRAPRRSVLGRCKRRGRRSWRVPPPSSGPEPQETENHADTSLADIAAGDDAPRTRRASSDRRSSAPRSRRSRTRPSRRRRGRRRREEGKEGEEEGHRRSDVGVDGRRSPRAWSRTASTRLRSRSSPRATRSRSRSSPTSRRSPGTAIRRARCATAARSW